MKKKYNLAILICAGFIVPLLFSSFPYFGEQTQMSILQFLGAVFSAPIFLIAAITVFVRTYRNYSGAGKAAVIFSLILLGLWSAVFFFGAIVGHALSQWGNS